MVNGVGTLDGPWGGGRICGSYKLTKEESRGHRSLWGDGRDRHPNPGGGEGKEQEGTGWGWGLCSVKFQASEPIHLLVLQSMDLNKGD